MLHIYSDIILNIDEVAKFEKLEFLTIVSDGDSFPKLPDNICLEDLIYFSADYHFSNNDKVIGFIRNQKNLRGLSLITEFYLKGVPDWLTELRNLETLSIMVEGDSTIPKEVLLLCNLETLEFITKNKIELDSSILLLSNLEMLNCYIELNSKNIEIIKHMKSIKKVCFYDIYLDKTSDSLIQSLGFLQEVDFCSLEKEDLTLEQETRLHRLLPDTKINYYPLLMHE